MQEELPKEKFINHVLELKSRLIKLFFIFVILTIFLYSISDFLYQLLLIPLKSIKAFENHSIIFTSLSEVFTSYISISFFFAFNIIIPYALIQFYLFLKPGLYLREKNIIISIILFGIFLYYCGVFFAYYYVMPKAYEFFLSFESNNSNVPILMQAKVADYLSLSQNIILAFGVCFEIPIIFIALYFAKIISKDFLSNNRKIFVVIIFVIAGFLTPPDVLSQFALAIPMMFLYELSILVIKKIDSYSRLK
jgi:sec-independent protein translocase protein TatC